MRSRRRISAADSPNRSKPPVTRDRLRRQPDPGAGRLACSSDSAVRLSAVWYSSWAGAAEAEDGRPACGAHCARDSIGGTACADPAYAGSAAYGSAAYPGSSAYPGTGPASEPQSFQVPRGYLGSAAYPASDP